MSKRKPLSAEEKQVKLLELFHETNDVYQLKDLERLAPQEKGIVLQSIKSTLQELVQSDLVHSAKIAGSLYYWSFPSENLQELQRQLFDVETKAAKSEARIGEAEAQLLSSQNEIDDLKDVDVITREIQALTEEKQTLKNDLKQLQSGADYEEIKMKESQAKKIMEAANRWTDNIFMTKTWCKRKFDKQDKELNKAFGIPEELDYVELS